MLNWLWLWNPANSAWVTNRLWKPCVMAKLNWYWLPAIPQLWGEHFLTHTKLKKCMCDKNLLYHTTLTGIIWSLARDWEVCFLNIKNKGRRWCCIDSTQMFMFKIMKLNHLILQSLYQDFVMMFLFWMVYKVSSIIHSIFVYNLYLWWMYFADFIMLIIF